MSDDLEDVDNFSSNYTGNRNSKRFRSNWYSAIAAFLGNDATSTKTEETDSDSVKYE
jgi:hypothetical protein